MAAITSKTSDLGQNNVSPTNFVRNTSAAQQNSNVRLRRCPSLLNITRRLFKALVYCFDECRSIHLYKWRINYPLNHINCNWVVEFIQNGKNLHYRISDPYGNKASRPINVIEGLTLQQMITYIKNCDVIVKVDTNRPNGLPIFLPKPVQKWIHGKNEIKLLRFEDQLIAQAFNRAAGYIQKPINVRDGWDVDQMIDHLKKCELKFLEDELLFAEICHTWPRRRVNFHLLRSNNRLIVELTNKFESRFENVSIKSNLYIDQRIDYLRRCEIRFENGLSFLEICYTWLLQDREITLLKYENNLEWQIFNRTLGTRYNRPFIPWRSDDIAKALVGVFSKFLTGKEKIHNFNCIPSDRCFSSTVEMINEYRTLESLIELIKDFRVTFVEDSSVRIMMEPTIIRQSRVSQKIWVSKFTYGVTLICDSEKRSHILYVLIEGVRNGEAMRSDRDISQEGEHFMYVSYFEAANNISLSYINELPSYDVRSQTWMVSSEKIKKLINYFHARKLSEAKSAPVSYDSVSWAIMFMGNLGIQPLPVSKYRSALSLVRTSGELYASRPKKIFTALLEPIGDIQIRI